jgi:hypothetical protein
MYQQCCFVLIETTVEHVLLVFSPTSADGAVLGQALIEQVYDKLPRLDIGTVRDFIW